MDTWFTLFCIAIAGVEGFFLGAHVTNKRVLRDLARLRDELNKWPAVRKSKVAELYAEDPHESN